ncbi:MAG: TetR/AcrR family transcriptional regulator [Syntrophothermus sp.]|uniref:TetR/AcrR family transcriptional regulator n=1 Tax=Syntrophothermus sp. TaxID=2736299 RepID=UPI00257F7E8A|nr:TetR/AcrR family transcriptional regulator [Syntrophothermus sp.]NSW83466.1 TetR/AcrR family transcriptional regulator [Syntrophothermus sp.]
MTSRKDAEKEFRKRFIAEVAYRLFADRSFETVTVEDIARAAEFGKGTLYQYFESKEEIVAYVIQRGISELCQRIEVECLHEPDLHVALDRLIELQYEFHATYGRLFLSLLRRNLDGLLTSQYFEDVKKRYEAKTQLTAKVLERGIDSGVFVSAESYRLARAVESVVKGFVVEGFERKQQKPTASDIGLIKQVLLNGIIKRRGENDNG